MTDGQDFNDNLDLPEELLTPLEIYHINLNEEYERHIEEVENIKKQLEERQKTCKHQFGNLHQIGWVPDVEVMGYTCGLCDFSVREVPKTKRTWTEWILGVKNE